MKQAINHNLIYYISFLFILVIIAFSYYPMRSLPVLGNGTIPYFAGIILCIICVPGYIRTRNASYVLLYIIVVFANHFWGNKAIPTIGAALTESISIFLPAAVFYLVMNRRDIKYNSILLYCFIAVVIITTVQSYILDQMNPGVIRATVNMEDESEVALFYSLGLSSYQLPHALPLLIPPCVMVIKHPDRFLYRYIGILFLAVTLVLVSLSQSFGAFTLTLFALLASVFVKEQSIKKNIRSITILFVFLLVFLNDTVQIAVIDFLRGFFEQESKIDDKLTELMYGITSESLSEVTGNRGNLLQQTFDAIIRNPLFGVNDKSYGNHNALLDRWACYGLVGFVPLLLFIYSSIKMALRIIPQKLQTYYIIGVISSLMMMITKNMMGWFQWLCFILILPLMFLVWKEKECNEL